MPLTSADLPAIVAALQAFKPIIEAIPRPYCTEEARDYRPVAVAGCRELAKAIAPTDPDSRANGYNEDIDGSDFPPRVKLKLLEVWDRVARGPHDPNCTPDQWSVLLEDAIRFIQESGKLPPLGGAPRQREAPEGPRAGALEFIPGGFVYRAVRQKLTGKPLDVLKYLYDAKKRRATLRDLRKEFWSDSDACPENVNNAISDARKALQAAMKLARVRLPKGAQKYYPIVLLDKGEIRKDERRTAWELAELP
jgi:hypothetical protein